MLAFIVKYKITFNTNFINYSYNMNLQFKLIIDYLIINKYKTVRFMTVLYLIYKIQNNKDYCALNFLTCSNALKRSVINGAS